MNGGPAWVVGAPIEDDTAWIVAYGSGYVVSFRLDGVTDEVTPYLTAPNVLAPDASPAVSAVGERLELLEIRDGSPPTHPVPYGDGLIGVSPSGAVVGGSVPGVRTLPLGFTLSTNIASTTDRSGRLHVAAGTMDGVSSVFR